MKSVAKHAQWPHANPLKLVEIHREDIESLPILMNILRDAPCRFIVFCDDLSFEELLDEMEGMYEVIEVKGEFELKWLTEE